MALKNQENARVSGFPNRYLFRFALLVAGEGCGCPVDTSVQSTEAPIEAGAETLNQFAQRLCLRLPACGAQNRQCLGAAHDFDRCAESSLPFSAPGGGSEASPRVMSPLGLIPSEGSWCKSFYHSTKKNKAHQKVCFVFSGCGRRT